MQASQLALKQAQSPDVRAFAKRMVTDHGKANAKLTEIASRNGMKPQADPISDPDVEALRGKSGHDSDTVCSAFASQRDRERAREAGFDAHCAKPLTPHRLLGYLESASGGGR